MDRLVILLFAILIIAGSVKGVEIAYGETLTIVKTVDEQVVNSIVFQDDDEFFFACDANTVYSVRMTLYMDSDFNTDYNTRWTLPTGTTGEVLDNLYRSDVGDPMVDATSTQFHNGGTLGSTQHVMKDTLIEVGSTTGTCQFQWAQAVDTSDPVTIQAGSMMQVWQVGADQSPSSLAHTKVIKAVDETVNNSIVLQDDDELLFIGSPNTTYYFFMNLFVDGNTVANLDTAFTLPTGATGQRTVSDLAPDPAKETDDVTSEDLHDLNDTIQSITFLGRIVMGSTGGTVQLQWAQSIQTVGDTKVLAGSSLVVWEEGTTIATSLAGAKGDKGDKGDTGASGARGADGASATSPVSNTVTPDPISESQIVQLVLAELGEQEPTFFTPLEPLAQTFFEFAVVDTTHNNLVLNSFLSDQRLGIRWSSGQDIAITSAIPSTSPFNITFEQFPVVKQGSGAVISTNFVSYTLQIPDNIEKARYEIPVVIDGVIGGNQVTDTGTITVNLTEDAFDPILLLILAMFGIPLLAVAIQKARGRSATPPVRRIING